MKYPQNDEEYETWKEENLEEYRRWQIYFNRVFKEAIKEFIK